MSENDNSPSSKGAGPKSNVVPLQTAPKDPPHRKVAKFVQDHPVMTIAGGLAVGVLAAALIPKGNRAYIARRGSQWADAVGAATAALAQQALERAEAATSHVRNNADAFAERAGEIGHAAKGRIVRAGESATGKAQGLLGRARSQAESGDTMASRASRILKLLHR